MFYFVFSKECFGAFYTFYYWWDSWRSDRKKGGERGDNMQHTLARGGIESPAAAKDSDFQYILFCTLYEMSCNFSNYSKKYL